MLHSPSMKLYVGDMRHPTRWIGLTGGTFLLFDVDEGLKAATTERELEYRGFEKAVGRSEVILRAKEGHAWKFESTSQSAGKDHSSSKA